VTISTYRGQTGTHCIPLPANARADASHATDDTLSVQRASYCRLGIASTAGHQRLALHRGYAFYRRRVAGVAQGQNDSASLTTGDGRQDG